MCLALIQLTDGNTAADGYLEIFFQGEWYTMCTLYYRYPDEVNGAVVCRELGYEGAVTTNARRYRYQKHNHLLWHYLYCGGDENSVYNCNECCTDQFYEDRTCVALEYACQSKPYIHNTLSSAIYVAIS